MRNIAEALVLGIIFGALYGLLQAILTAATGQRVEWTDVSGKTFLVAIVSGLIVGGLRAWQLSRSGRPFGWHNLGAILAVIGGLLLIAYGMWPAMPLQLGGDSSALFLSFAVGLLFLIAVFVTDRSPALSKALLAIGVAVLLGSALWSGTLIGGSTGWLVTSLTLLPMVLGAIAAATIGPAERGTVM
jgi:hypothetical protein